MATSHGLPFAGPITEFVSGTAGMAAVVTGVIAGCARALAVLRGSSPDRVELMTAVGFGLGVGISILFVVIEGILELR